MLVLLPALLLFLIPAAAHADSTGSIAVTLTYTNGDTADYWPVSLKVYQDSSQVPYLDIESVTGNPFNIVSLPANHQYKIAVYANSMYSTEAYVNLQQAHQDVTIKIPLPGGMRINAFYNDGVTPIANATVYVRSAQDNKTWGHSTTNADGNSLRFWIEPTIVPGDHYAADIRIGSHLVYTSSPVYLRAGTSQDIKITTDWPPVVNSLVTARVLNSQSHPVSPSDGKFSVSISDSSGNKIAESPVTPRGEAYFSNLKVGDYTFKATRTDNNSEWASANVTEDGTVFTVQIMKAQNPTPAPEPPVSTPQPTTAPAMPQLSMPSCNCVAFRLDNIQDYWLDDVQIKIIDTFASKNAGITVGIIGKAFGNDSGLVNYLKSKSGSGSIDAAINGWSFEDFTTLGRGQQANLLQESKTRISGLLGTTPSVFIPPYARSDNDTLYAMSDSGISTISGSSLQVPQDLAEKIHSYPANIFSGVLAQNTDQSMLNAKILSGIRDAIRVNGYAIVTLNFQNYAQSNGTTRTNMPDMEKIQNLQSLIDSVRDGGYSISTVSGMASMFKPQPAWVSSAYQWSLGRSTDAEFLSTVKTMVQQGVIHGTLPAHDFTSIPGWVKHDAVMHSHGAISDGEFLNVIEYLVRIQAIR